MANTLHMTFQPFGAGAAVTIEVLTASFDAEQTLNIGSQSTGAGAGKVTFKPLSFTKRPDALSADFWSRLCSGTPFRKVSLEAAATGSASPFLIFTMGLVALRSMSVSASDANGLPLETVTVEYGQAAYSVTPQNADGSLGKAIGSGWDRVKNIAIDPAKVGN